MRLFWRIWQWLTWRPETPAQMVRRRVAKGAYPFPGPVPWRDTLRADPCSYCNRSAGTIDHIQARAAGGPDRWWNVTGACSQCNAEKKTDPLLLYMLKREQRRQAAQRSRAGAIVRLAKTAERARRLSRIGTLGDIARWTVA